MSLQEIKAQVKTGDRAGKEHTATYDIPDSVKEAVDRYGEEVVYTHFKGSLVIAAQAVMRNAIKKDGATDESVASALKEWTPEKRAAGKPFVEKMQDFLRNMSPEERLEFLSEFGE